MFCSQCGVQISEDASKCFKCGAVLRHTAKSGIAMKKKNKTFMIVAIVLVAVVVLVAIMGILAAIAIPAYIGYSQKAKMVEVVHTVGAIRNGLIAKSFESGGQGLNAPDEASIEKELGIKVSSQYFDQASIKCNPGEICMISVTIRNMTSSLNGRSLVLSSNKASPELSGWNWDKSTVPGQFLPK